MSYWNFFVYVLIQILFSKTKEIVGEFTSMVFLIKQKRITHSDYSLFQYQWIAESQQLGISYFLCFRLACAAAIRAIGTRKGEQLT